MKEEFRESCGGVFNRSDEKTSTKTIANNYNYNFLQIKPTLIEGQISMKRKVQAHSPSTSGQSGILVLNPHSIIY